MHIVDRASLIERQDQPFAFLEGRPLGAGISLVLASTGESGVGPYLHQHPYPETFVIHSGRALFTVGNEQVTGVGGQIIVVPAFTPHKFEVLGSECLEMTDIHASDTFITEWLEGPRAAAQLTQQVTQAGPSAE